MKTYYKSDLLKDAKTFCLKYNKLDIRAPISAMLYKRNINDLAKASRFATFYYELGKTLKMKESRLITFIEFIAFIADICHSADDLKDTAKLNKEDSIRRIQSLLLHYDSMKYYLDKLDLNYDSIKKGFRAGINLFMKEERIKHKKNISDKDIYNILEIGSPDFQMYNELLAQLIPSLDVRILNFLRDYAFIDWIIDHISDLEEDFKNETFNPLIIMLNQRVIEIDKVKLPHLLASHGIFDYFVNLCFIKGRLALDALSGDDRVSQLVKYYMAGELEGLKLFVKYKYFIDVPERNKIIYLILKPHPWEVYKYEGVFS